MNRFFLPLCAALFLLAAAASARAQETTEPPVLGIGAIAESCALQFPGDAEAAKACEVTTIVIRELRAKVHSNEDYISWLHLRVAEQQAQIAELAFKVSTLEETKEDKRRR